MSLDLDRFVAAGDTRASAGSSQAKYFRAVLAERLAHVEARIADDIRVLRVRQRAGGHGVKSLLCQIRRLQQQGNELQRLIDGLDARR